MKLWILRPREELADRIYVGKIMHRNPWVPWYDKNFGYVVRAETEEQARQLADQRAMEENSSGQHPWLQPMYSTCTELTADGDAEVIMIDFARA